MRTAVCDLLDIKIPIVLAPMGIAVGPKLTAAVCNAGGLGTIPLWRADIETLRKQIREVKSLTDKPFAVNLNLDFPQEERLEACLQERVPVISFFWGDPGELVSRAKTGGAIVMQTVGSAKEATSCSPVWCRYCCRAGLGGGWPRVGNCCNHGAGASRCRRRSTCPGCCCWWHCRRARTCCGFGARCIRRMDWHAISCKQRGNHSSALPRPAIGGL